MAEYIKRDDVLRYISEGLTNPNEKERFGWEAIVIMGEIQFMPAADVVEVVRCKDCRYCALTGRPQFRYYRCTCGNGLSASVKEDDFCPYGERREHE